ncbi:MAG: hypothetical protein PUD64_09395 [Bacteroidales bacterium]|nr:hypothetical protein [Bacteroidales bacterium]
MKEEFDSPMGYLHRVSKLGAFVVSIAHRGGERVMWGWKGGLRGAAAQSEISEHSEGLADARLWLGVSAA